MMDENLALLVGNLAGAALRMEAELRAQGIEIPGTVTIRVDDAGNYTNQFVVTRASGSYLVTVEKETP